MTASLVTTDVPEAVARLRAGGVVAIPTETVYGLAADADNPAAVDRIFEIKGRPRGHPLIVHLSDASELPDWARDIPASAALLASTCWPGPLTLLLRRAGRVLDVVTGGRDTVGVRVPSHPLVRALLHDFGGGLAAPSANRFGSVSPTTADHVLDDIGARLDPARDAVLDGGPSTIGVESTIVDCTVDPPQILRPGGIATEDVERIIEQPTADPDGPSRASGMLASHYAPACQVVLVDDVGSARRVADEAGRRGASTYVWDRGDDLVEAARCLYGDLRRADRDDIDVFVAVLPPAQGLGHAIRDRLMKAAADRRDEPTRDD